MELTASRDIDAPQAAVFDLLSNFDALESRLMARGIRVERIEPRDGDGGFPAWRSTFTLRGKERSAIVTLATLDRPDLLVFDGVSGGLETGFAVAPAALSPARTRLVLTVSLRPQTLSARLLVQSLKLNRSKVEKRLKERLDDVATEIEAKTRDAG